MRVPLPAARMTAFTGAHCVERERARSILFGAPDGNRALPKFVPALRGRKVTQITNLRYERGNPEKCQMRTLEIQNVARPCRAARLEWPHMVSSENKRPEREGHSGRAMAVT